MLTLPMHAVSALRDEIAQESFLERFGNFHPHLTGGSIDLAFRRSLRTVASSDHIEMLERAMERFLGIVSDEEE